MVIKKEKVKVGNYQKASVEDEVAEGEGGVKRVKVEKDEDGDGDSEVEFLGEKRRGRY